MNRRHFLETLAAGLLVADCAVPARTSMPAQRSVPVERDENGLTPLRRFFVTAITSFAPRIDVTTSMLTVGGAVEHSFSMLYEELATDPQQTYRAVLQCVGGASGTAEWVGMPLRFLLDRAGIQSDAKKVVFYAGDGYESSIPVAMAMKPDSLLAHRMNGAALQPNHGSPVRLVLPGVYGYKQVKWITRIDVVTENHKGYWEQRGYSDDGTIRS
ncbi:MAG: molybdopterin-dependent oxidoreductase [Candidatus Latescibacteria bacterium]|jgi:DMSO/TMAO reductase YedYZ molybdopterin-dependent catalytic subunit|nr:molybdopterin-dependent oxidoreductase [Candidatus Latescibacterota bacterium]